MSVQKNSGPPKNIVYDTGRREFVVLCDIKGTGESGGKSRRGGCKQCEKKKEEIRSMMG